MVTTRQEAKKKVKSTDIGKKLIKKFFGQVFFSGGQSKRDAKINLNELRESLRKRKRAWPLTFSYG